MQDLVSPEVTNAQLSDLKKIVYDLITISGEPKSGVTKEQLSYALSELEKIRDSFREMEAGRVSLNKELDEHSKSVENLRNGSKYFLDKYGKDFYPKWYKSFLKL